MPLSQCNATYLKYNRKAHHPAFENGVSESQYCAYNPSGSDSCNGDSGGPLQIAAICTPHMLWASCHLVSAVAQTIQTFIPEFRTIYLGSNHTFGHKNIKSMLSTFLRTNCTINNFFTTKIDLTGINHLFKFIHNDNAVSSRKIILICNFILIRNK